MGEMKRRHFLFFPFSLPVALTTLISPSIRVVVLLVADIAPPDGAPVRPFHLDPRLSGPKDMADQLWARIGEASGLPPPPGSRYR